MTCANSVPFPPAWRDVIRRLDVGACASFYGHNAEYLVDRFNNTNRKQGWRFKSTKHRLDWRDNYKPGTPCFVLVTRVA